MSSKPQYTFSGVIFWGNSPITSYRKKGPSWISGSNIVFEGDRNIAGKQHRVVGPARIYGDGVICFMMQGVKHRTSGPAVIYADGEREYWIKGKKIDSVDFFVKYGVA